MRVLLVLDQGFLSPEILRNELLTDLLCISGVLKPKSHVIPVIYSNSNLPESESFFGPHPGWVVLSIQVFYPSHGFGIRDFSQIYLGGRKVRVPQNHF